MSQSRAKAERRAERVRADRERACLGCGHDRVLHRYWFDDAPRACFAISVYAEGNGDVGLNSPTKECLCSRFM